jgi:hypothetical protein
MKNGVQNRHIVTGPRLVPRYARERTCLSVTFLACSRGVLPLVSNHDCTFATVNSWVIAGGSTAILIRVALLIPPNAKPLFLNSAIPSMAAS